MKSFNKIRLGSSNEKLAVWNPPDMDTDLKFRSKDIDVDKARVIALFSKELTSTGRKEKGPRSALRPAGTDQNISVWKPSATTWQSPVTDIVRKDVWDFMELPTESSEALEEKPVPAKANQQAVIDSEKEISISLQSARAQAEEIILNAQTEADNVLAQAQTEIDEQKKEGYQQGLNEARLEMEEALNAVRAMVVEVDTWKTTLTSQGEPILVAMLKEIAVKLFGDGAELDSQALQANLNRIMDSAHGLGGLNIFLNPKDARMLDSAWVDQQLLISGGQAKIIPSVNITRGGCYVKGNMGTVDGRVETQLEALLKAFDEASILAE
jgi:flagellar assembly protein FliH